MAEFLLTWKIDIDADSAEEAVEQALDIQRDPYSAALHFTVLNKDTGEETEVDGEELIEDEVSYHCQTCDSVITELEYKHNQGLCGLCVDAIN